MSWFIAFGLAGIVVAAAASIFVHVNRQRFAVRIGSEMQALLALAPARGTRLSAAALPPVVERYRRLAVADHAPIRTLRFAHGGTFRMSPRSKPRPIRGVQLFTADPPGFLWQGRVKMCPGVWIDARDMLASGEGSMRVLVDDTFAVADAKGPHIDQGSALRLLAELVWYPTALFDARTVTWAAVDPSHARATLALGALTVTGTFEFGPDGLPIGMTAERYEDKRGLRRWGGVYRDWRTVAGMRVPFEAVVSWLDPVFTYAHWRVEAMTYDAPGNGAGLDRPATRPMGGWAKTAMVLEIVLGIGAVGGGLALMVGPHGEVIPLPVAALAGSPFASYFVPGAILFAMLGVGPLVAAGFAGRRNASAPYMALAVGCALVIWIAVEIAIVGYSNKPPLQAVYLALGVVIAMVGFGWIQVARRGAVIASQR